MNKIKRPNFIGFFMGTISSIGGRKTINLKLKLIMKKKSILITGFITLSFIAAVSCNNKQAETNQTIDMETMIKSAIEGSQQVNIKDNINYYVYDPADKDCGFAYIDKIVYKNNTLYISDFVNRRIVSYNHKMGKYDVLNKQGRSNKEYLQITDFDIDNSGGYWILDAQKDAILYFDKETNFKNYHKINFESSNIEVTEDNEIIFDISSSDKSKYSEYKVLVTDSNLKYKESFIGQNKFTDPNFEFPAQGILVDNNNIISHRPIDDTVYVVNRVNNYIDKFYFDFGDQKCSTILAQNIEQNIEEIYKKSFLVKTIYINDNIVIGGLLMQGVYTFFVLDRNTGKFYLQDNEFSHLTLLGISNGFALFQVNPEAEITKGILPEGIYNAITSGKDVLATVPVNSISIQ